jgi:hypothetical protein
MTSCSKRAQFQYFHKLPAEGGPYSRRPAKWCSTGHPSHAPTESNVRGDNAAGMPGIPREAIVQSA